MKIAIIGYGKMGKMIEKIAQERGHQILFRFDVDNKHEFTIDNLKKADVAIEFSTPQSAYENVKKCFDANLPVVSGTTGWLEKMEELKNIAIEENKAFFYASNFSIGVNIVFYLNRRLAQIMNQFNQYVPSITEIHHIHKKDAPSGTAISLANGIIENLERVSSWTMDKFTTQEQIKITAIREDEIPGIHTITYESDFDIIQIRHEAKGREGFATGAILAAEFLLGKKGFYTMENLLQF